MALERRLSESLPVRSKAETKARMAGESTASIILSGASRKSRALEVGGVSSTMRSYRGSSRRA
jgi:hypothetical protein